MGNMTSYNTSLAAVLRDLMEENGLDMRAMAERCGVTYQTIKNALDGHSVNRKFISELIRQFDIEHDPQLLRRVLLAFLIVQFGDEGEALLRTAGLVPRGDGD